MELTEKERIVKMATKKMTTGSLEHKLAVLQKLYKNRIRTEKELAALDLATMLSIEGINIEDLRMITELQNQVKANKLFSFLGEQPKEEGGNVQ